jgi:hypothetical protein
MPETPAQAPQAASKPQLTGAGRFVSWMQELHPLVRAALFALVVVSLWANWPRAADLHLESAARTYLTEKHPDCIWGDATQQGWLGSYHLTFHGVRGQESQPVMARVRFSTAGGAATVAEAQLFLSRGGASPAVWIAQVAVAIAAMVFLLFVSVPRTFGRKCPRDRSLLQARDVTVVGQQFDRAGVTLPLVLERWYECRQCDFRHVDAFADPNHRPAGLFAASVSRFNPEDIHRKLAYYREHGLTEAAYDAQVGAAKAAAREKCSPDSPWLQQ